MVPDRTSIAATFDSGGEPGAYEVETRINGKRLNVVPMVDPFVSQRVVIGWRDALRGLLRRRLEVEVLVGGDRERVEDVCELDGDYLGGQNSSRRKEWNAHLNRRLGDYAAMEAEHDAT